MDMIMAIAMLCMSPNGATGWKGVEITHDAQLKCQKYYVECTRRQSFKDGTTPTENLLFCIQKKGE